ncbi:MAG: transcription-repair coupling factor [Bdellovibrionales bacterium]|nr:transcription-repair coupling factor [Bdellovibrionales bacterium]
MPAMNVAAEPIPLALLGRLTKSLEFSSPPIKLVGLHSCAPLALYLSQSQHTRLGKQPHVVVTPDLASGEKFIESLHFFDPNLRATLLPPFDVSIYSNLYPNHRIISKRISWLYQAHNALPGQIFVTSVEALLQKTLPYSEFVKKTLIIKKNSELPNSFIQFLNSLGYSATPTTEDVGTYSQRGGILDIFSPGCEEPYRLELFGDTVESIRTYNPVTQISTEEVNSCVILPAREALYTDDNRQKISTSIQRAVEGRNVPKDELQDILRSISQGLPFYGLDFLLPYFYDKLDSPLDYFSSPVDLWFFDHIECVRIADQLHQDLKSNYHQAEKQVLRIKYSDLYSNLDSLTPPEDSAVVWADQIEVSGDAIATDDICEIKSFSVSEFVAGISSASRDNETLSLYLKDKIGRWRAQGYSVIISAQSHTVAERVKLIFERADFIPIIIGEDHINLAEIISEQNKDPGHLHIVLRSIPEPFRLPDEHLVFLRDEDILGKRKVHRQVKSESLALEKSEALSFGDLQIGDLVVHRVHGIGIYEGLKPMQIDGADSEFIELSYKGGDRLYIPVYRIGQIHKYTGPTSLSLVDKLGGSGWAKTKIKVRNQVRDVADKLLRLYAKRSQETRPPFSAINEDFAKFENSFPYQETEDQLRAIHDVLGNMCSDHPMDRLVCGDVGFGKTEVAMRATFKAVQDGFQVAIIAPTTILTHQHFENFKRRFASWPIEVRSLNRFVAATDVKKTLAGLAAGTVDIVIGTHRLLSKDIAFKNLGLLIIDEEQKFGVIHKEKLRQLRTSVDTLALSATPIPRSLNMSLVGMRDLSIINTPPEDRLPTRTFVCKFDKETIRKAIESEIGRAGQTFFLHNRVQSIDEMAAQIRSIVPSARIAVAHGQMDEDLLEKTMLRFYHHELDVLVCTAIIESGMDIPRANTIFIDQAHTFGVSQLYQLRGRVGRSKERAYCYLLVPPDKRLDSTAQERLKIIQENTALGSGLRVAQYDLELRGAGDILGENQSGHINAVGYDLYIELLEEAIAEQRGDEITDNEIEPEINLRVPALLPDKYIPDLRMRLYYYKTLSNVRSVEDIDKIETELHDQFGSPPEPVMNLLGLMLIRKLCRDLGVKDVSAGKNVISLTFTPQTRLPTDEVIRLTARENKKYSIAPDQRLKVRMNDVAWPRVIEEMEYLISLCPKKISK